LTRSGLAISLSASRPGGFSNDPHSPSDRRLLLAASPPRRRATAPTRQGRRGRGEILERTPLIDGHNDLAEALRERFGNDPSAVDLTPTSVGQSLGLHTDIPRLRAGGVGAQFWSVYVPADLTPTEAAKETFEQIDTVRRIVAPIRMCSSWPRPPTTSSASTGRARSPA
jgi:hypothetical protein